MEKDLAYVSSFGLKGTSTCLVDCIVCTIPYAIHVLLCSVLCFEILGDGLPKVVDSAVQRHRVSRI